MASLLHPHIILLVYWLIMIVLAAFFLRLACSLCRAGIPSWRRSFVSVFVVTLLAYMTFDFTCYLTMKTMDGVLFKLPPWYSYSLWFREPIGLKWYLVSLAGPLRLVPFILGVFVAALVQFVVLQADVTFGFGLLIVVLQWAATVVAGYIVSLLFGVVLSAIGATLQSEAARTAFESVPRQTAPQQPTARQDASAAGPKTTTKNKKAEAIQQGTTQKPKSGGTTAGEPASPAMIEQKAEGAGKVTQDEIAQASEKVKAYANSYLDELREQTAPITKHLPQPVQDFLDKGNGWWWVLGVSGVFVVLWVRSIVRRLTGVAHKPKGKKRKKRRAKGSPAKLREDLKWLGEGLTAGGPQRLVVKGLPARLRLVVLSMGNKSGGDLSDEMADRVLDEIKPGLAEITSYDNPGVRVWPAFYSSDGFATGLASNLVIPEPKGMKSHWVVMAGDVRMGKLLIHVGLALHAEKANNLRFVQVKGERWLNSLTVEKVPETADV
jgi:hypothetical protein